MSAAPSGHSPFGRIRDNWPRRERGPRWASRDPTFVPGYKLTDIDLLEAKAREPTTWLLPVSRSSSAADK